jgi:hypothetical protein
VLRRTVRTHQYHVARDKAGMHDSVLPPGWHLTRDWHFPVGHHRFDLAAKYLLIEPERFRTLAVEIEVRNYSYCALRWLIDDCKPLGSTCVARAAP